MISSIENELAKSNLLRNTPKRGGTWWWIEIWGHLILSIIILITRERIAKPICALFGYNTNTVVGKFTFGLIGILCVIITVSLMCKIIQNRNFNGIKLATRGCGKRLLIGMAFGGIASAIMWFLVLMSLNVDSLYWAKDDAASAIASISVYAIGLTASATMEEILIRGYVLTSLTRKNSIAMSIIASSALFTLLHFESSLTYSIGHFLFGVAMSLIAIKTGDLWASSGFHTAWNLLGLLLTFLFKFKSGDVVIDGYQELWFEKGLWSDVLVNVITILILVVWFVKDAIKDRDAAKANAKEITCETMEAVEQNNCDVVLDENNPLHKKRKKLSKSIRHTRRIYAIFSAATSLSAALFLFPINGYITHPFALLIVVTPICIISRIALLIKTIRNRKLEKQISAMAKNLPVEEHVCGNDTITAEQI